VTDVYGSNYTTQGELFERLTAECLRLLGWHVHATGWSRTRVRSIGVKVQEIAAHLGESVVPNGVTKWTRASAKDAGLDVVCCQPFPDGWGGRPICLVQCASGDDWDRKMHTPSLVKWAKLVDFTTYPSRGLSMPFAPMEEDFRFAACNDELTLLLDRHRLLAPCHRGERQWVSAKLATALNKWTRSRVKVFPRDDE
jgi:hypothetical protein